MPRNDPQTFRPNQRVKILSRVRNLKMARNAHAYVRGSTDKFYEWPKTGGSNVPTGPSVWICGDCHLGNLGPLANADGNVNVQIRDLDQTVIGNPAHDLIRLGLSLASAMLVFGEAHLRQILLLMRRITMRSARHLALDKGDADHPRDCTTRRQATHR
jgi:uncharacterized protein (DUF2252 family)